MTNNLLTNNFSEPLNGARIASVDIHAGDGNLTIDQLPGGEQALASGMLQYFEKQGQPTQALVTSNGQTNLTLRGGKAGQPWFHFPWAACNGATEWQIYLNPTISTDLTAHSDGGNLGLNLAGMNLTCLSANTGGGNLDIILPDNAADLNVTAKTGAGNVTLHLPSGSAARIHATTGLGKVIVDPQFGQTDKNTYQSPDFDRAANKVDITANSGAGNVSIITE